MKIRAEWNHTLHLIWAGEHPTLTEWICRKCARPILPGQRWDLGHLLDQAVHGPNAISLEPEHADKCNRAAGGRLAHTLRAALAPSRAW